MPQNQRIESRVCVPEERPPEPIEPDLPEPPLLPVPVESEPVPILVDELPPLVPFIVLVSPVVPVPLPVPEPVPLPLVVPFVEVESVVVVLLLLFEQLNITRATAEHNNILFIIMVLTVVLSNYFARNQKPAMQVVQSMLVAISLPAGRCARPSLETGSNFVTDFEEEYQMSVLEISVGLHNSTDEIIFLFAVLLIIFFYGVYKEYCEEVQNKELLDQFLNNQPPVS